MHDARTSRDEETVVVEGVHVRRADLLEQMERMIASKHFRNSKRYPSLFRFVIEQTLAGHSEELKERTLGIQVFNKPNDYDTNADPIVRVTAGEIRKRIAQYYQEPAHRHQLRIDLPLGSYVPQFLPAEEQTAFAVHAGEGDAHEGIAHRVEAPKGRRARIVAVAFFALAVVGVACFFSLRWNHGRQANQPLDLLWKPILTSSTPPLIVIGVHTLDSSGHDIPPDLNATATHDRSQSMLSTMISSDMLPVGDLVSYSKITELLTRHGQPYDTLGSDDATLDDLRHGPVVLIGALDNVWTIRLLSKLRYKFFAVGSTYSGIVDTEHPATVWTFDNTQRASSNSRDYALVAGYFDASIEQHVFVVAGVGKTGTHAASEFLTSDKYIKNWHAESKIPYDGNFEILLSTEIVDGRSGPPEVLASYTW